MFTNPQLPLLCLVLGQICKAKSME